MKSIIKVLCASVCLILIGGGWAVADIIHTRATERACAWAERADMYEDCAQAFNTGGSQSSENLRHYYGDPTGE